MPDAPTEPPAPQPPGQEPYAWPAGPPAQRDPTQRDPHQRETSQRDPHQRETSPRETSPRETSPRQTSQAQRNPAHRSPTSDEDRRPPPTEAAITLAQAEQRLAQERMVMQAKLDKDRALRRIQVAMGWLLVVMLPSVAIVSVAVMINYQELPGGVVTSAAGAFFVDIVGLVVAGWRTLLVRNLRDEPLTPVTQAPDLMIDVRAPDDPR